MRRSRWMTAAVTAVAAIGLLASCSASDPAPKKTSHPSYTAVPTATPTPVAQLINPEVPLGGGVNETVYANVFPVGVFRSTAGCGCTRTASSTQELFPKGTYAILLKVQLRSGSDANQLDAKGLSFKGTKFEGRPEFAVMDTKDGQKLAAAHGLPWLPEGAFAGKDHWMLPTRNATNSIDVAVAYYLPPGEKALDLVVDVPGHDALTVGLDLPPALQQELVKEAARLNE